MKFNETLMTVVRKDLDNGLIPMLLGEPGIGKSSWAIALGNIMRTKVFVLPCNQLADKADLTGARLIPVIEKKTQPDGSVKEHIVDYKQAFYPHATISEAIRYAQDHPHETPILFMDELNRTTPDVTSEALSIPTLRSIGSKQLPENLRIITAGNDKGNITSLDEASISRFVLYHVEPDTQTFLALDPELNIFVQKVLNAHPECIFCKTIKIAVTGSDSGDDDDSGVDIEEILDDSEEMLQIATPRTITGISRWLNSCTNQELMALIADTHVVDGKDVSVLEEILEGHTGKTNFTAFLLAEIASGVMTMNNQQNVTTVPKPSVYDKLKACATVNDVNMTVQAMTDNDKSGCMVYALYEKANNGVIINALAQNINTLMPSDIKLLMNLYSNDRLDTQNMQELAKTNSNVASTLSIILQ